MPLVPCKCTSCGASLEIDNNLEAAVCKFCGTAFIVEKAINNYKTVNITMDQKNEAALVKKGKRLIQNIYFDAQELYDIADTLSDISEDEFYSEFFLFCAGQSDNMNWLIKNSNDDQKKEIIKFLWNAFTRDYNKESFDDVKINILKNFTGILFRNIKEEKTHKILSYLNNLKDYFDSEDIDRWDKLVKNASDELEDAITKPMNIEIIIALFGYAKSFTMLVNDGLRARVSDACRREAKKVSTNNFVDIYNLSRELDEDGLYEYKIATGVTITYKNIFINGSKYPIEYCLKMYHDSSICLLALQLDETKGTVIRLSGYVNNFNYLRSMPNCNPGQHYEFADMITYKQDTVLNTNLKLVYIEGFSYRKSLFSSVLEGIGKFLH